MRQHEDPIREAVWKMVSQDCNYAPWARWCHRRFRWQGTHRQALARCSQWLNPRDPHQLPALAVLGAIEVTGLDLVTPILLRAGLRKARKVRRRKARGAA